jgi:hypothetical protein
MDAAAVAAVDRAYLHDGRNACDQSQDEPAASPCKTEIPPRRRDFCKSENVAYSKGTSSSATMLMILINGFTAGPAVSLYGSPTVSPVTAALCASEPLPP